MSSKSLTLSNVADLPLQGDQLVLFEIQELLPSSSIDQSIN